MESISVIIPTYNRKATLIRAINSVLNQTVPVKEILVCDDGSTDNSWQEVEQLKRDNIIWLPCGRNGRPAIPRNRGILKATGNWVAFLDSDDEWLPEKLTQQLSTLKQSGLQAVAANANRIVEGKSFGLYGTFQGARITFNELLSCNYNICSSVMVARDVLLKTAGFPEAETFKAIEDYSLWLKLTTATDFAYIPQALLNYYDNSPDSIRTANDTWKQRYIIFTDLVSWIRKNKTIKLKKEDKKKLSACYTQALINNDEAQWKIYKERILHGSGLFR